MDANMPAAIKPFQCVLITLVAVLAAAPPAIAAEPAANPPLILGELEFPTSGAPEAQDAFERGVMLLHSFEYDDARNAFLEAQAIDPTFAMAIWGEAMTLNHPLWNQQNREEALNVLEKLPPSDERSTTALEERFIDAVQALYSEGSKKARDLAYRDAMAELHADYPNDLEVAAFYALSILGSVYERDFRTYMQAAAVAEEVFAKEPQHPGAAHYLIHSYDDQIHAPLGLRAARAYTKIAPSAPHAQHMVSHIYTSLGRWDEVVEANRTAVRVSEESMLRAGRSRHMRSKHSLHWLEYALLQQGRYDEAIDTLRIVREDVDALPDLPNASHSAMMRASFAVEAPLTDSPLAPLGEIKAPLYSQVVDDFASAWSMIAQGALADARQAHTRMQRRIEGARVLGVEEGLHEDDSATSADDYLMAHIIAREIEALLAFHAGDAVRALELLGQALEDETGRPPYYGPPHIPKPTDELMGEMLLTLERPAEAAAMFEQSLARHTNRTLSLVGLARAQEAAGSEEAAETWSLIDAQWRSDTEAVRDLTYPWLPEIRASAAR
jgi:tetratricopeptide (TPR) repeat protein